MLIMMKNLATITILLTSLLMLTQFAPASSLPYYTDYGYGYGYGYGYSGLGIYSTYTDGFVRFL